MGFPRKPRLQTSEKDDRAFCLLAEVVVKSKYSFTPDAKVGN
jgi:hypothetical protein